MDYFSKTTDTVDGVDGLNKMHSIEQRVLQVLGFIYLRKNKTRQQQGQQHHRTSKNSLLKFYNDNGMRFIPERPVMMNDLLIKFGDKVSVCRFVYDLTVWQSGSDLKIDDQSLQEIVKD